MWIKHLILNLQRSIWALRKTGVEKWMLIEVVATEADSKTFDVRITSRICIKFPTVCYSNGIYCQEAMSRFASGITECIRPAVDVRERGKPA